MATVEYVSTFRDRFKELIGDDTVVIAGQKLGISKSAVSAYLTGQRSPKDSVLKLIANYYNVDVLWLMGLNTAKYKEAPGDTEGLSPDRQALIDLVMSATEEEVRALRGIVNQVLALRGK